LGPEIPLSFLVLDEVDPDWCTHEAEKMMAFHPPSELANSSGKFYANYQCWHFHQSSSWPLIKVFRQKLESHAHFFREKMQKNLGIEFIVLSLVEDFNSPVSLRHKDGFFFDGQAHLTIAGHARIGVEVDGRAQDLYLPNGCIWYLNGSEYYHEVKPATERRIEMCAPINQKKEDVLIKRKATSKDSYRWLDGRNEEWTQLRLKQTNYVKRAIEAGRASNLSVASFSIENQNL
jgi:hypothetical protein